MALYEWFKHHLSLFFRVLRHGLQMPAITLFELRKSSLYSIIYEFGEKPVNPCTMSGVFMTCLFKGDALKFSAPPSVLGPNI